MHEEEECASIEANLFITVTLSIDNYESPLRYVHFDLTFVKKAS